MIPVSNRMVDKYWGKLDTIHLYYLYCEVNRQKIEFNNPKKTAAPNLNQTRSFNQRHILYNLETPPSWFSVGES